MIATTSPRLMVMSTPLSASTTRSPERNCFVDRNMSLSDQGQVYLAERELRLDALARILRGHGLPMHWEFVAQIADDEVPELIESPNVVRTLMFFNPAIFHHIGDGVFELAG